MYLFILFYFVQIKAASERDSQSHTSQLPNQVSVILMSQSLGNTDSAHNLIHPHKPWMLKADSNTYSHSFSRI